MDYIEILKWAGVVFVVGFIGYFGKFLSKMIIGAFSKKSMKKEAILKTPQINTSKKDTKLQKKLAKAKVKKLKKLEN